MSNTFRSAGGKSHAKRTRFWEDVVKFASCFFLAWSALLAQGIFDTEAQLERYEQGIDVFYEAYLAEQRALDDALGLAEGGRHPESFTPPPNPPPPAFVSGHLPIVLVNRSGYPDSQVYFLVTGKNLSNDNCWGSINIGSGVVSLQEVQNGDNSTSFMVPLTSLPQSSTGRVAYVPQTISGLCWFSIGSALSMGVSGGEIVQPNPTSVADPNYSTNYDIFEYDFQVGASPQVSCDATAVSFFSIPQYGYLAGATSAASNTGLYQPRSYIISKVASVFNEAPLKSQWNKLLLSSGSSVLRILSTMKSMSIPSFDSNYLDNEAAYGYSYIADIWDGPSGFYQTNDCTMTVTVTSPGTATYTYTGSVPVGGDNTFAFTSGDGGPNVTFLAPTTSGGATSHTSYLIFAAQNLTVAGGASQPTAGTAADAVSKLFEEALIAGLLPTTDTLSLDYLSANQANFYTVNPNLSSAGQATGPWYDLYSKALHGLGSIYTYGFDEPLWPNVLLTGPFTENSTYIGITIGNCQP